MDGSRTTPTPDGAAATEAALRAGTDAMLGSGALLLGWMREASEAQFALTLRLAEQGQAALAALAAPGAAPRDTPERLLEIAREMGATGLDGTQRLGALAARCNAEAAALARDGLAAPVEAALRNATRTHR